MPALIPALWERGVWWMRDYAYALRAQIAAARDRTPADAYATGSGRPVVMLPGIYEDWRFLRPLAQALHERGHPVHVVTALGRNRWPVPRAATHVARLLRERDLRDVVLVAHSKGGLVGKHLMSETDTGGRLRALLAVATPFGGSRYSRLMPTRALRAFAANDPVLRSLAGITAVNARIVSVYAAFDPHIPEGSELAGARNVRLPIGGHFRILAHPRVLAEFDRLVADTDPDAYPKRPLT